ncbi:MAG: tetratricopeptide repeat protein [Pseudomonadota bacterium]
MINFPSIPVKNDFRGAPTANWLRRFIIFTLALAIAFSGCASEEDIKNKHLENAQAYIAKNEFKAAELELKNVIQMDSKNDVAHYLLGQTYMKMGEVELAARSYSNAIIANPENLKAHLKIGQIFLAAHKTMGARKAAKFILEKTPDDIDAHQLLAAVQIQENNVAGAIKTLQSAAAINPKDTRPQLFLGHLLSSMGDIDEAERTYLHAISVEPSSTEPYVNLIRLYGSKDQWDKAQAVLDQMGEPTEKGRHALMDLAKFCEGHRKWDMAEKIYKNAVAFEASDAAPLMNLGSYYARRGAFAEGLVTMRQALNINPDDPDVLANIAGLHLELKNPEAAEEAIGKALKINSDHVQANYLKGTLLFFKKDFTGALDRFENTIRKAPENAMAYYYKALCLIGKGSRDLAEGDLFRAAAGFHDDAEAWVGKLAEENLLKAIALNPNLLAPKLTLAQIYLRSLDRDKARQQIEGALALAPGHLEALALQGSVKILERDFKGAEAVCRKALASHPDNSQWLTRLAVVYATMQRPADALASCQRALEITPLQFDALQIMIDIHLRDRAYPEALAACEKQKKRVGENSSAIAVIENMEGTVSLVHGKPDTARRHFQKALDLAPEFISPRLALARMHTIEKAYDEAISQYEKVLSFNADHLPACMAIGDICYFRGDKKKAEKYYRRALEINNGYGPAANNLAFLLSAYDNKVREALGFAQLAEKKMPQDANAKDTLGWIHYRMGNYYQAITLLEKSLAINPDNAMANYHMGLAYYQNKEFDKARAHLKKALKLNPDFEGAVEARALAD